MLRIEIGNKCRIFPLSNCTCRTILLLVVLQGCFIADLSLVFGIIELSVSPPFPLFQVLVVTRRSLCLFYGMLILEKR